MASVGAIGYRVGETYEVLSMITMREGEELQTGIVAEVTAGNVVQVLELGTGASGRRLKVSVAGQIGWVSCETSKGEQLISRGKVKKMGDLRSDTGSSIFSFSSYFRSRSNSKTGLRSDTMSSQSTAATISRDPPEKGEKGETLSIVTIRESESLDSPVICELPKGITFILEERGEGRRAKIKTDSGCVGWLSIQTKRGEPLVAALAPKKPGGGETVAHDDFEVGGQHETKSVVTMRESESLESAVITDLKPGMLIKILEIGTDKRRAKVQVSDLQGWISLATRRGELLVGKVSGVVSKQESSMFGGGAAKIKALLEGARGGDLEAVKKVVGDSGLLSKLTSGVSINSSDVRGKTALTYAAAFGNKDVVAYLVQQKGIDVNALDDTQKIALHHAAKKARRRRAQSDDAIQAAIIQLLIQHGAYIEARDHNGCTALMFACTNGDLAVTKMLMHYGASVNVKDYEGHTSLDYARTFRHDDIVKFLKEHGAEGEETDEEDPGTSNEPAAPTGLPAAPSSLPPSPGGEGEAGEASPKKRAKAKVKVRAKKKAAGAGGADEGADEAAGAEEDAAEDGEGEGGEDGSPGAKKPRAKVKVKAKGKGKAKGKMARKMSMTDKMDDAPEEAIQVIEEVPEAVDPKVLIEQATKVLKQAMEDARSSQELELAIKVAENQDVSKSDIRAAEKKVKALKAREKARDELSEAVVELKCKRLKAAIEKAKEEKVDASEIAKAEQVLAVEQPKQDARDRLKKAEDSGAVEDLKAAIKEAKRVSLEDWEIEPFEELLRGAESKQAAEDALKDAIESRDVGKLRFAIQQGKNAGVGPALIGQAEEIFAVEEPKQIAREMMESAMEALDVPAMKKAVEAGRKAGLTKDELQDCEEMILAEQAKAEARQAIADVLLETKGIVPTDIDGLSALKAKLTKEIKNAREVGLKDDELSEVELRRRKIHNAIEDLKGSIRVFCRIRPLSKKEISQGDTSVTEMPDNMTIKIAKGGTFLFDAVFGPGTQEEVFEDCRDLVQSALDGYNVTLFAYGQTGAGKTFTMYGVPGMIGVCPRTVQEVFSLCAANSDRYHFTIMGSMIELYRNDLVDLLNKADPTSNSAPKLHVRADATGQVIIEHMIEREVHTCEEFEGLLNEANAQRTVAATAMNSESSRSHLIMIMKIISINNDTKEKLRGKILLCDLAGSERLKKSEVSGDLQKEAIEINKSLTALGDVIEALTKKQKQIPYRNHKLTQVMQDSLGGTAKTLMFVNCSPAESNTDETVMSLKYAARAKKITNTAVKRKE